MAVGMGRDAGGNLQTVVGTSEPGGYLRPGVSLNAGEVMATGTGRAEVSIINEAGPFSNPFYIAAGRPICPFCAAVIDERSNGGESSEMTVRLSTIALDLTGLLAHASPDALRSATLAVVDAALQRTELRGPAVVEALGALGAGRYGAGPERDRLKQTETELDDAAWDLQDRAEAGDASQDDYLAAFKRARAASALWFALDDDALQAALERCFVRSSARRPGLCTGAMPLRIGGRERDWVRTGGCGPGGAGRGVRAGAC